MHWKMDDGLAIGKYTGLTIEEIIQLDPQYVDWMMRTWKDDTFDEEVIDAVEKKLRY